MTRTRQVLLFLGACTFSFACGGDDDDGIVIADSGPTADSGPDASLACGDFDEASDADNDEFAQFGGMGTAETSGISFAAGDTKTICGVVESTHFDAESTVVDIDAFDFEVGAGAPLRVVVRAPDAGEDLTFITVLQFVTPEGTISAGGGGLVDGYALASTFQVAEGTWRIVVITAAEAELSDPVEYEIEIGNTIPCDAVAGEPDYTEATDGRRSRRNDVVTGTWVPQMGLQTEATTVETDNPEPTEITLEADTPVHLVGTAGNRPANDSYRDKDTFALAISDDVTEIDLRITWPDEAMADLDGLAFVAEMPANSITGTGAAFGGLTLDELVTGRVASGSDLWIWVGTYDDGEPDLPMDYDITICPRSFTP